MGIFWQWLQSGTPHRHPMWLRIIAHVVGLALFCVLCPLIVVGLVLIAAALVFSDYAGDRGDQI